MKKARKQNKHVEHSMSIRHILLFTDAVKNRTDGIKYASQENQHHTFPTDCQIHSFIHSKIHQPIAR